MYNVKILVMVSAKLYFSNYKRLRIYFFVRENLVSSLLLTIDHISQ